MKQLKELSLGAAVVVDECIMLRSEPFLKVEGRLCPFPFAESVVAEEAVVWWSNGHAAPQRG